MKTIRAYPLMLLFALAASFPAAGQTKQSGYVKTRGRLADDGRLLPGERLAGASVILKGGNSTVSGADGSFTLTLSGSTYILQNVRKQGYEICDPEILARQYTHSANPHILILETPARKLEEKLAAERKIRRTLQRTLAEREEELESLRAQHRLTRDEYNAALQQLYAAQRNDEQLIGEMAARYSRIDYDQLDDYRRQLSLFIREGELRRADSLLNSRGSFADRAAELERLHEANEQEAARLAGERD
ncbi:MAG: hypothetical protein J1E02_07285, partial [Coprobacter sp.]|nr:hypothetical protein [Coprobacter sp.]